MDGINSILSTYKTRTLQYMGLFIVRDERVSHLQIADGSMPSDRSGKNRFASFAHIAPVAEEQAPTLPIYTAYGK